MVKSSTTLTAADILGGSCTKHDPNERRLFKDNFELGGGYKKVSNKEISLGLGIAAGSVTEMITKLTEEGLVSHEPYDGIALTPEGIKHAAELVRKHRLWETF